MTDESKPCKWCDGTGIAQEHSVKVLIDGGVIARAIGGAQREGGNPVYLKPGEEVRRLFPTVMWAVECAAPGSRTWALFLETGAPVVRLEKAEAEIVAERMAERHPRWRYRTVEYQAVAS